MKTVWYYGLALILVTMLIGVRFLVENYWLGQTEDDMAADIVFCEFHGFISIAVIGIVLPPLAAILGLKRHSQRLILESFLLFVLFIIGLIILREPDWKNVVSLPLDCALIILTFTWAISITLSLWATKRWERLLLV